MSKCEQENNQYFSPKLLSSIEWFRFFFATSNEILLFLNSYQFKYQKMVTLSYVPFTNKYCCGFRLNNCTYISRQTSK